MLPWLQEERHKGKKYEEDTELSVPLGVCRQKG